MWLQHPQFHDIVTQSCLNQTNYPTRLKNFTNLATEWNQQSFGNIFYKKKILLARLKGIQLMDPNAINSFHYNFENHLITDFNNLLRSDEEF